MLNLKKFKLIDWLLVLLLLAGFSLQLYLVYYGYRTYNFLVPPGSDAISHYNIIQKILETGKVDFHYPPIFHLLVIFLNKVTGISVFHILTYWTPILVVLPAAAMFFLLRQLFDKKVSVLTTIIFLLTSSYPLHGFIDGNYPDILAYGVFGILMFAFVIRYLRTKNLINLIIASVLLILIAFTHHLTFVGLAIILLLFGLVQFYIVIIEKKFKIVFWGWQFLSIVTVLCLVSLSFYFAFKFYGSTILKFADGFLNNTAAIKDQYLNQTLSWPDYTLISGDMVWFLGTLGLFLLLITTFKERKEVGAKQLILIWIIFYFAASRFSSTGLPARFARELAPALVVCIGFLLNYIFNLNSLGIHRYKLVFGYGLMGFLIITNSAIFTGPAQIPESFSKMIWFWPKDQETIDYINSHISGNMKVVYNPYANLYMPIKAPLSFNPLKLDANQLALATQTQKEKSSHYDSFVGLTVKRRNQLKGYDKLIYDLSKQLKDYKYIYIGVTPPSRPDPKVYPKYAYYEIYNKVIDDLGANGDLVKKFPDGSRLIKMF